MLGMRNRLNTDTSLSPAAVTYAQAPLLPGLFAIPTQVHENAIMWGVDLKHAMKQQALYPLRWHTKREPYQYLPKSLMLTENVLVREERIRPILSPKYTGPFNVLARAPKYFIIFNEPGEEETVSVDRLKPYYDETSKEK